MPHCTHLQYAALSLLVGVLCSCAAHKPELCETARPTPIKLVVTQLNPITKTGIQSGGEEVSWRKLEAHLEVWNLTQDSLTGCLGYGWYYHYLGEEGMTLSGSRITCLLEAQLNIPPGAFQLVKVEIDPPTSRDYDGILTLSFPFYSQVAQRGESFPRHRYECTVSADYRLFSSDGN